MSRSRLSRQVWLLFAVVAVLGMVTACSIVPKKASTTPSVEEVSLCAVLGSDQRCQVPAVVFGTGDVVYCSVKVADLEPNSEVMARWYRGGFEVSSYTLTVEQGGAGFVSFHLGSKETAEPGDYRVEIFLNQDRAQSVDFRVQGAVMAAQPTAPVAAPTPTVVVSAPTAPPVEVPTPTPPPPPTSPPEVTLVPTRPPTPTVPPPSLKPTFGAITFAEGVTASDQPEKPAEKFPQGIKEIYGVFAYEGMADGVTLRHVWVLDGEETLEGEEKWIGGSQGKGWWVRLRNEKGILPGEYTVHLYVEGEKVQEGAFTVYAVQTGYGAPRGRIVYTVGITDRKNYEVWIMNADGSGQKKLADLSSEPTFSPDGKQVAFYGWEGKSGGNGIWLMNSDGSDERVFLNDGEAAYPMWSPKGDTISYTSYRGGGSWDIYIKRVDDGSEWKVVDGKHQSWAPDASRLVINSCVGSECGLYLVNIDGGGLQRFTNQTSDDFASWSPDGKRIIFCSQRDGNWEVYVMNADGSAVRRLTNDPAHDVMPVWLPTGNHIAYRSTQGGAWGIWVMDRDGGNKHKIADVRTTEHWGWEKMDAGW